MERTDGEFRPVFKLAPYLVLIAQIGVDCGPSPVFHPSENLMTADDLSEATLARALSTDSLVREAHLCLLYATAKSH